MTPVHVAVLLVAGLAAGAVNGIAGGGTLLSFPALLAVGLSPVVANVTNTVAIWPGYLGGTATYRAELRAGRPQLRAFSLAASAGAVAGTVCLLTFPASIFHALVPYLVIGATALLAAQPTISRAMARRQPAVPATTDGDNSPRTGVAVIGAVTVAATYGAYFGGGLGIILVAVLALGLDAPMQRVNAVKTLLALVVNTVALLGFVVFGPVDWAAAALVAPASFAGGIAGAWLGQRLDPRALRAAVVVLGFGVGIRLLAT